MKFSITPLGIIARGGPGLSLGYYLRLGLGF